MAKTKNISEGDKSLAILVHVLGIFTGFIGPLVIFLVSKEKFSRENAKNALNWQISLIIYMIISGIMILFLIGFLMIAALSVVNLVFSVMAAVKANEGSSWKYPMTISFIK